MTENKNDRSKTRVMRPLVLDTVVRRARVEQMARAIFQQCAPQCAFVPASARPPQLEEWAAMAWEAALIFEQQREAAFPSESEDQDNEEKGL